MAVKVRVEPEAELPRRQREELVATITAMANLLSRLESSELRVIHGDLVRSNILLGVEEDNQPAEPDPVLGQLPASRGEQAAVAFRSLLHFFAARRQLLDDDQTLTAPQVAEILGVSRQTPLNRARENTLLGVLDRGAWRFPVWQFDPDGPGGVVEGLAEVLDALEPQPEFSKLVWFHRPNPTLSGRRPAEALREGDEQPVVDAARAASTLP